MTLPARRCALAPATDTGRKAAAIDGTDRRTDGHPTVTKALHRILFGQRQERCAKSSKPPARADEMAAYKVHKNLVLRIQKQ